MADSFLIDYKEEIKKLISISYEPANMIDKELEMNISDLVESLRNVLPYKAVDDHLVYEALTELNFVPHEKGPLEYIWFFRRKIE